MTRTSVLLVCAAIAVAAASVDAAELKVQTAAAFNRYVQLTERRIDDEVARGTPFLWLDRLPDGPRRKAYADLLKGGLLIERGETRDGSAKIDVPSGLVHHWVGLVFVDGVHINEAVTLLQDYNSHASVYSPNITASRTLSADGEHFQVYLRFFVKKIIGVTMDTEHEAEFVRLASDRAVSRIHSTRIAEVADASTATERQKPPGQDNGFMWRLNTYWRFLELDGGTYVQCESLTLSRDIPFALGWLIRPFVTQVPKESLTFTLERTRTELQRRRLR